jgi:sigma-E factor negative regulatory protein RseC
MIHTKAVIVHLQGNKALVESTGSGGCGQCNSEKGCGSGKLAQLFCTRPRQFTVLNESKASVGDEVQITLPDGVLLRSSMLIYALPLSFLLAGGMLGSQWASDSANRDAPAALGSLVGLIGGFFLAKWAARRQQILAVARPLIHTDRT